MMGFIQKIKDMWALSERLMFIENELKELESRMANGVLEYSKQFEKKIQDMTFAYTRNLDDTKSDYLKRYLEQRLDSMGYAVDEIPRQIDGLRESLNAKIELLENKED